MKNSDTYSDEHYCLDLLKAEDSALYSSVLFLSEENRPDAAALHAFNLEISRIPFMVSEPTPGEIRLQWWREAISGERAGEAAANPLAAALNSVIKTHDLPVSGFDRYLEARIFDLYQDPMPDRTTLEAYLGETESFILQMLALSAGAEQNSVLADACGHAGVAIGIAGILTRMPQDRRRQRIYLPADLLEAAGLAPEGWLSDDADTTNHSKVITMATALGYEHAAKVSKAIRKLDRKVQSAFLPLAIAKAKLRYASSSDDILSNGIALSPLRVQWSLWKAALRGI